MGCQGTLALMEFLDIRENQGRAEFLEKMDATVLGVMLDCLGRLDWMDLMVERYSNFTPTHRHLYTCVYKHSLILFIVMYFVLIDSYVNVFPFL